MSQRYALTKKIEALDLVDKLDGDMRAAREQLDIPLATLANWRAQEDELRRAYNQRRRRQRDRLFVDLQLEMLNRGQNLLDMMSDDKLAKAPVNQLASALGSLVSHALKLADVIEESQEEKELVIRHEYYTDGELRDAPPWPANRARARREVHGGGLRPALGQDNPGQNGHAGAGDARSHTSLVAGADIHDGQPGLARPETSRQAHIAFED